MKKGLTEIVFILDNSGSMAGLEKDTIMGYNSFLEKQKITEGDAYVSTVFFNTYTEVIHDRIDLKKTEPLTDRQYRVGGGTALLDAIGKSINHIGNIHKYAREEDVPEKTIFVITTDGQENSSHEFSYDKIKKMISHQSETYQWEFIFMGANIDAIEEAGRLGIKSDNAVQYECDSIGTNLNFLCVSERIIQTRKGKSADKTWKKEIENYRKKREK